LHDIVCTCCVGSSMHLPLLPGIQIHVSMPPHFNAPSPSVLQSQPPQQHHAANLHTHRDSTALQGGEARDGVKPGQKASHQGRSQCGTAQDSAYAMQQPSLKQGKCIATSCFDMCLLRIQQLGLWRTFTVRGSSQACF